jgi:hypothetical protein
MNALPPGPVLPFAGFLEVLRSKGYGVGLNEHFALAQLLDRWDRTHAEELADAIAALVGRNEEEAQGIRQLFVEIYLELPAAREEPAASTVAPPTVRRRIWLLAPALALAVIAVAVWRFPQTPTPAATQTTPAPVVVPSPVPGPPPVVTPVELPPPAAPKLPDPPRRVEWQLAAQITGAVFLAALAIFWALKSRHATRKWLRETWASALAALPGPYHFDLVLRDPTGHLPRADVEDAATILGRTFTPDAQARQLDVRRSVRMTLRRGMLPQLVFKPRRTAQSILVFQDICQEMRIWQPKIDTFLADLVRQGVPLERWYFDGDPRRVADRPFRATVRIDAVIRARPGSPVLMVSTGSGIEPSLATGDLDWLQALRGALRKSWLTPVTDLHVWPAAFNDLTARTPDLNVWPMTRLGLSRAARDLAGLDSEPADRLRSHLLDAGMVTDDDVERMKRLASVVPHPTPELLEVLRRKFAPDVPDAAVLPLLSENGSPSAPVIRMSDEEVRRCLAAVRLETPQLEAAVRQTIIGVLSDSEPTAGSAAHQRWQLSVALQRIQLADIAKTDASESLATIKTLAASPIWEEVRLAARRLPASPAFARHLDAAIGGSRDQAAPPPGAEAFAAAPQPWSWPGLREIVPAAMAASILFGAGLLIRAFPARALDHRQDAYQLSYITGPPAQLELRFRGDAAGLPRTVPVMRDAAPFVGADGGVAIPATGSAVIPLASGDTGHYYQARAVLPAGNLAVSNAVWVPSDTAVVVSIDASPWANVTIQQDQLTIAAQPTPFSAALVPGTYTLRLENGGVTQPTTQTIQVTPANRVFRFTMPGFDPSGKAAELSRPPATQK